jgi:hypothetical protein
MTQLIFKNDLEEDKLKALLGFLKTWDIDAEVKTSTPRVVKSKKKFSLSIGLWNDYTIDSVELRKKA